MLNPVVPAAPAERLGPDDVRAQAELIAALPAFGGMLNALPVMAAALNPCRQIVFANERFTQFVGARGPDEILGLRVGEVLGCVNSNLTPGGCGTAEGCSVCGALRSIVFSQTGHSATNLGRLRRVAGASEDALELDISGTPIGIDGQRFTLILLSDDSNRLRRTRYEHEVIPAAVKLAKEIGVLASRLPPENPASSFVKSAARQLTAALRDELDLVALEAGALFPVIRSTSVEEVLQFLRVELEPADRMSIAGAAPDCALVTDPALLSRALAKLVRNALEAGDGPVTIRFDHEEGAAEFRVHNDAALTRAERLQMFQPGFSTKGPGRGYGVYFARLAAERCLGGTVSFRSSGEHGTEFTIYVPLAGPEVTP